MFDSKPDNEPKPFTTPPQSNSKGAPPRGGNSPFAPAASAATGTSVIGTDLTILGENITIISQNKLQVDGDIRGNVHGKQVVIGTVCAEKVEVRGGVRGSIRGISVALHSSAQVEGDITHQRLAISEGAHFDGRVRKSNDTSELTPVLDPEKIPSGGSV